MKRSNQIASGVAISGLAMFAIVGFGAGASTSVAAPAPSHGVMIPAPPSGPVPLAEGQSSSGAIVKSSNWSGYAQNNGTKKGPFTGAEVTFAVPTVTESHTGTQFSAQWVGVGGYNESTLVQDGVEADNHGGTPVYQAWTEILPAAEVPLKLTINPGDQIQAIIREIAVNSWSMTVADLTTGTQAGRTVNYNSNGASAEVILERPEIGGSLASLAKTSKAIFDPGEVTTTAPGSTADYTPFLIPITGQTVHEIAMTNNGGNKIIAIPSKPDADSDGFAVADGSVAPKPPKT